MHNISNYLKTAKASTVNVYTADEEGSAVPCTLVHKGFPVWPMVDLRVATRVGYSHTYYIIGVKTSVRVKDSEGKYRLVDVASKPESVDGFDDLLNNFIYDVSCIKKDYEPTDYDEVDPHQCSNSVSQKAIANFIIKEINK